MTHVTCRLTANNRDQLWSHTLGNRVWATFTFNFFVRSLYAPVEQMLSVHDVRQGGGRHTGLVPVVDWSSCRRCRYLVMSGLRAARRPGRGLGCLVCRVRGGLHGLGLASGGADEVR